MPASDSKDIVLITGVAGDIGSSLVSALSGSFQVVGMDRPGLEAACDTIAFDLTDQDSVEAAFNTFRERYSGRIASVVHLAAYFDFSGEASPLYDAVNVEGTRRLMRALQSFEVEQFVYSGTMLVHEATEPGHTIDEHAPLVPRWAYPESKMRSEEVIREEHNRIPYVLLHLAGLYDDRTAVPTLAHQIKRIYERSLKSHMYPADPETGQAFIHKSDLVDVFKRVIEQRRKLPLDTVMLIGEPDVMSFQELQDEIGRLVHGQEEWTTLKLPKSAAMAGAWLEAKAEPVVPDALDQGKVPFIRPFMIALVDQHYALDISRARNLIGWEPRHSLRATLPKMIEFLKADPMGWYAANGLTPPIWLQATAEISSSPETMRRDWEMYFRREHQRHLWGSFLNVALGAWLMTSGATLGYQSTALVWSDFLSGVLVVLFGLTALSWQMWPARWAIAAVGVWLLFAPLVFWAPTAGAYLNDTLVGGLLIGFAGALRPMPGVSIAAAMSGPVVPPGWSYSPSGWFQRIPIIALAIVGLLISRHLTAYQLGHIDGVWEPFFAGGPDPKNGTEEIITSWASEAWPVPDAGVGAVTYMLEIVTGLIGSNQRWRTMPWLVVLFGILIVPLGVVSITFIIIQPILLGTWCTLCLIAAAAMLLQIPYSLDELVATGQFIWRRKQAGRPLLQVFLFGDTDEEGGEEADNFEQRPRAILHEMVSGGMTAPWTLLACLAIGAWLMFTRVTIGATDGMADVDHIIGALVITVTVAALAEVARGLRFANAALGAALLIAPFAIGAGQASVISSVICGLALIGLSIPRGRIANTYGNCDR
ncbi:MAG: NAD-dependent epimerase/dehydratase family protein, partial [Alphaproteobacteria bacterium]|nr:NAD-dependent epimerase/dehydratase family protein [Alphaproteobacteria bacterium]